MCERLLRQSVCLHSQSPPQKLCVDDESLDSLVFVRTCAAIAEGASRAAASPSYHSKNTRCWSIVHREHVCACVEKGKDKRCVKEGCIIKLTMEWSIYPLDLQVFTRLESAELMPSKLNRNIIIPIGDLARREDHRFLKVSDFGFSALSNWNPSG